MVTTLETKSAASALPGGVERFLDEKKALACIHCGLCLSSCPTYLETANENDSPRGRIYLMRAVQDGRLEVGDTAMRHIDSCLGCRACEAVCPSGVLYGELLEHTRDHLEKHYQRSLFQRFLRRIAIEKVFPYPARLKWALAPARLIQFLRMEKFLPKFAREALSLIPNIGPAVRIPQVSPVGGKARGRVGFLSGCVMSVMFGETNAASIRLLNRDGYEVVAPLDQGCCGALFSHSGKLESARECARRNIAVFEQHQLDLIIINAAGCGSTMKEYGQLLRDDPAWAERARTFSAKVKDLTEFISVKSLPQANPLTPALSPAEGERGNPRLSSREGASGECGQPTDTRAARVTYHDACHLAHAQRVTRQPRDLVKAIAGKNFVELPESDVCCGSAGTYNLTEMAMAERLEQRKIENILKTGAQIVVTSNPGCLLQIRAGLRKAGSSAEVVHIADFIDRQC
jgi:glycolate oxidase iron-sulfur subunit